MTVSADAEQRAETYARAVNVVREAARRERRALESARVLAAPDSNGQQVVSRMLAALPTDEMAEARLAAFFTGLTGEKAPATPALPAHRQMTAAKVPALVDNVQGFLDRRDKIKRPDRLHPLMFYETLNFADGTRTYLDIYRAVAAEADAAGEWYYGTVTFDDVASTLDSAVSAGVLEVKTGTR